MPETPDRPILLPAAELPRDARETAEVLTVTQASLGIWVDLMGEYVRQGMLESYETLMGHLKNVKQDTIKTESAEARAKLFASTISFELIHGSMQSRTAEQPATAGAGAGAGAGHGGGGGGGGGGGYGGSGGGFGFGGGGGGPVATPDKY